MVRIKRGIFKRKRKKRVIKMTRGFKWRRKTAYKAAKEALMHALVHAYRGRKRKKRDFRRLWQLKINNACREYGINYSRFINALKQKKVELNRKILADLAVNHKEVFRKIVEYAKS